MNAKVQFSAVAVFAALTAACGTQSTTSSENPVPSATAPAAATPTPMPSGIFVAGFSGADANDGSPASPLRTINAAIERALQKNLHDVYLFGGIDEGSYLEVIRVRDGVSLHGSVCKSTEVVTVDIDSCKTTISGGTPTLVASGIRNVDTIVENLELRGSPAVQTGGDLTNMFFQVDGAGCVGRGNAPAALERCTPAPDARGRVVPQSALGAAINDSSTLVLRNVHIVSAEAGSGIDGIAGENGADGQMGRAGYVAGDVAKAGGMGGDAGVNLSCPEANGGAGGLGGRWYWDGVSRIPGTLRPLIDYSRVYHGNDGAPAASGNAMNGGLAGAGAAVRITAQMGLDGADGISGATLEPGSNGIGGAAVVDFSNFVAQSGTDGFDGRAGIGGGGAGGGAPASIELYTSTSTKSSGSAGFYGFAALGASTGSYSSTLQSVGETAGGGAGAGGAGGCGGLGGLGGQGGAASIGLFVKDSQLRVLGSAIESGLGGKGGNGGAAGRGGNGAVGGQGGTGHAVSAYNTSGHFDISGSGSWLATSVSASSSTDMTTAKSASQGGAGGRGGSGANGAKGGVGAGGAGGASFAVVQAGATSTLETSTSTITAGTPGAGGGPDEAKGETGLQKAIESL